MPNVTFDSRKRQGLCTRCGVNPLGEKWVTCHACHEDHRKKVLKIREERKQAGLCDNCGQHPRRPGVSTCSDCGRHFSSKTTKKYKESREECIKNYGAKCKCCGTSTAKYLQLDHVNNDGKEHRRYLYGRNKGSDLYTWACRNNFPSMLQLLCANCHQAKTHHGGCSPGDHNNTELLD
jgi:hypothetical protein